MKRDFSWSTYQKLRQYIDEVQPQSFLGNVWDVIADIGLMIKHLFKKPDADTSGEALDQYCKEVIDKRNLWIEELHNLYQAANDLDDQYGQKAGMLAESGRQLLKELQLICEAAVPERLAEISQMKPLSISFSTDLDTELSDEALQEYLESPDSSSLPLRQAIMNVSSTVLNFGMIEAIMISLFHKKDILLSQLMSTPEGEKITEQVRQNILNGIDGYDSVKEIAQRLGLTEEQVRILLESPGNLRNDARYNHNNWDKNAGRYGYDFLDKYEELEKIVEENLNRAMQDNTMYQKLSEQLGIDAKMAQAIANGEISGYQVDMYKQEIMEILKKEVGKKERKLPDMHQDEAAKILKGYQKWYAWVYKNGEKSNEALKEMMKGNTLSAEDAISFLKTYCGYAEVTPEDIRKFQSYTEQLQKVDWLAGALKKVGSVEKGGEILATLLDHYSEELELLDSVEQVGSGSPNYQYALKEIREAYTKKGWEAVDSVLEILVEKGADAAVKKIPLMSELDAAISITGAVTGATKYTSTMQKVTAYASISAEMVDSYARAQAYAKEQNYSHESLERVRNSFAVMKQTLIHYYDAQAEYADGMNFGALENKQYRAYAEAEKRKLENLQLSLSKNFKSAHVSAIIIEEMVVFLWKTGEKMHGMSRL